jgi:hypothetical protein
MGDPVPAGRIVYRPGAEGKKVPVIAHEFAGGWRDA